MKPLDSTDQKILALLEQNGRATIVEIAEQVGLSQTPCAERIKRMEREGVISGYIATLNPELVGRGFTIFIQVKLREGTNQNFDIFAAAVNEIDEVLECHMIAGGFDCLLKISVADMQEYRSVIIGKISVITGIERTDSFPVIEVLKSGTSLMRL